MACLVGGGGGSSIQAHERVVAEAHERVVAEAHETMVASLLNLAATLARLARHTQVLLSPVWLCVCVAVCLCVCVDVCVKPGC